jgi:amino acid transporter
MAIIQQPTSLFTKLALLGMYYQFFSPKRPIKYAIIFGMVICTLIYTTVMFVWIFIEHFDDQIGALNKINKSQAFLNLGTDIYIFIIPLVAVSGLHMSRAQKLGLATVFMTGALAVISCIISVVYRFQYMSVTGDLTWQMVPFYIVL